MRSSFLVVLNTTDPAAAERLTDKVRADGGTVDSRFEVGSFPAFKGLLTQPLVDALRSEADVESVEPD